MKIIFEKDLRTDQYINKFKKIFGKDSLQKLPGSNNSFKFNKPDDERHGQTVSFEYGEPQVKNKYNYKLLPQNIEIKNNKAIIDGKEFDLYYLPKDEKDNYKRNTYNGKVNFYDSKYKSTIDLND